VGIEFMPERHFIFMTRRRTSLGEIRPNDGDAL